MYMYAVQALYNKMYILTRGTCTCTCSGCICVCLLMQLELCTCTLAELELSVNVCMSPILCMWTCRLGPADGGGDEGVGSNWSGVCHRLLELPPHVADMEGTVTQLSALSSHGTAPPFLLLVHCNVLCGTLSMCSPMAAPVVSSAGVSSTGHGQHSGAEACHLHQIECSAVC